MKEKRGFFENMWGLKAPKEKHPWKIKDLIAGMLSKYNCNKQTDLTINSDAERLSVISVKIKSISHQSILYHGEEISKAKKLLARYSTGTFTKWLQTVYGNTSTPYDFMRYYELHQDLLGIKKDVTEKMVQMPRKLVYRLSNQKIDILKKIELIEECYQKNYTEIEVALHKIAPPNQKTKPPSSRVLYSIRATKKLCIQMIKNFSLEERKEAIRLTKELFDILISEKMSHHDSPNARSKDLMSDAQPDTTNTSEDSPYQ